MFAVNCFITLHSAAHRRTGGTLKQGAEPITTLIPRRGAVPAMRNQALMCKEVQQHQSRPFLTIAVPTYNRAWCLKDLLAVLASQLKDEPRVELIISDNASSDETPSLVRDFMAQGLPVRYLRNPENIGPDANFLQCFEEARGKYVWLFSDDDLIIPGALAKILVYCEAAEYDLIWVSAYPFKQIHEPRAVKVGDDVIAISDAREYAKRVHVLFTFISGNIINKDRVLEANPTSFSSLVGTCLIQLGWTYTALNGFVRGLYIREKLIAVRENNTGGYQLFQVFGPSLERITKNWVKSASVRGIVMNGTVQRFWPLMLLRYKKCAKDFAQEAGPQAVLTPVFGDNFRYWAFAYPVIVLPSLLAAAWVFAGRVLNRVDKAVGFVMLNCRDNTSGG